MVATATATTAAAATVKSRMQTVQVMKPAQLSTMKFIVYGEPGVGKTRLLAQIQDVDEWSPALFVSIEAGTLSIVHRDIDVVEVSDDRTFAMALRHATSKGYRSLVIDSVTLLQKVLMRSLMERVVMDNPKMTDIEVPSMREWGIVSEKLQKTFYNLSAANLNVFLSCLERTDASGAAGRPVSRLDLPGKLPNYIGAWADIIGRLVAALQRNRGKGKDAEVEGGEEVVRVLAVQPGPSFVAKDRTGKLGKAIRVRNEDTRTGTGTGKGTSTMTDIYAAIFGKTSKSKGR